MSNSGVHETEDLKRDIIAGATLGPCKNLSRELLRCQIFRPDPKKYQEVNKNFYQCLQNYAEVRLNFKLILNRNIKIGAQQKINTEMFIILIEKQENLNGIDLKRLKKIL